MTQQACIFCKIIGREIPAPIIKENELAIVIIDIAPKAPYHYLLIPKKHITDLPSFSQEDLAIAPALFALAQELGSGITPPGFRLIMNNGKLVGQSVFHAHMHFLAGKQFSDF